MAGYSGVPLSIINTAIDNRFTNIVIIQKESDFPVQDGTTITGESGYLYYIVKPITTAKQFIGDDCRILGIGTQTVLWTYTGTGSALQNSATGRLTVDSLNISATNGTAFTVNGDNTGNANQRINISSSVVLADKIMTISGAGAVVIDEVNWVLSGSVLDAITVSATNMLVFNMSRAFVGGISSGGSVVNFGTATSREYEISDLIYDGDSAGHVFKGLSGGGNVVIGSKFVCEGGNFTGSTTPLVGLSPSDIRIIFRDNAGLADSFFSVDTRLSSPTTVNITSANSFVLINNGAWTSTISSKLSVDSNGVVTNISEDTIIVKVLAFVTAEAAGGIDKTLARIVKNANPALPESVDTTNETENATSTSIPLFGIFTLAPNDTVALYVANGSITTDIYVTNAKLIISEKA